MILALIRLWVDATKAIILPMLKTLTATLRLPSCLEAIADAGKEKNEKSTCARLHLCKPDLGVAKLKKNKEQRNC